MTKEPAAERLSAPPSERSERAGSLPRAPRGRAGEGASHPPLPPHSRALTPTDTAKERAKPLRREMTPPERVLWSHLRAGRCFGIKFRRQHPMGDYILDFYCHDAGLDIEIDGRAHDHRQGRDRRRDEWLCAQGVEVLRIPAWKISRDHHAVVGLIAHTVERRMESLHPGMFAEKEAAWLAERAEKKVK